MTKATNEGTKTQNCIAFATAYGCVRVDESGTQSARVVIGLIRMY
jgi:hypothetical protein